MFQNGRPPPPLDTTRKRPWERLIRKSRGTGPTSSKPADSSPSKPPLGTEGIEPVYHIPGAPGKRLGFVYERSDTI